DVRYAVLVTSHLENEELLQAAKTILLLAVPEEDLFEMAMANQIIYEAYNYICQLYQSQLSSLLSRLKNDQTLKNCCWIFDNFSLQKHLKDIFQFICGKDRTNVTAEQIDSALKLMKTYFRKRTQKDVQKAR